MERAARRGRTPRDGGLLIRGAALSEGVAAAKAEVVWDEQLSVLASNVRPRPDVCHLFAGP